jgi:hypothetical protein
MKALIAAALLVTSFSAFALQSFLVSEWDEGGNHFCKYDNGTVLNVGYNICPLSI